MASAKLNTDIILNNGNVDITVYEDIGNTGSTNNSETISGVQDGVNTYNLSSIEGGKGNAYWNYISISTTTFAFPTLNSLSLEIPTAGSIILLDLNAVLQTTNGVLDTE